MRAGTRAMPRGRCWLAFARWRQRAEQLACACAIAVGCFAGKAQATELFAEVPPEGLAAPVSNTFPDPGLISRARVVRADRPLLDTARETVRKNGVAGLELNLFPDASFNAVLGTADPTATGFVLSGKLEGMPFGRVTLVVNRSALAGVVHTPTRSFVIRQLPDDTLAVAEVDFSLLPPCGVEPPGTRWSSRQKPDQEAPREDGFDDDVSWPLFRDSKVQVEPGLPKDAASAAADEPVMEDDGSVIDVAVLYTSGALEAAGGRDLIEAEIDLAAAQTNAAYANSDVDMRIKIVFVGEFDDFLPSRTLTRDWPAALMLKHVRAWRMESALATGPDGGSSLEIPFRDGIEPIRSGFAADLVHIVGHGNCEGCAGVAYLLGYLGFTEYRALPGLVFAHELGHNMGLRHDRYVDPRERPFPYGRGYVNRAALVPGAPGSARWRTIMAYNTQCRVQGRFPCPSVPFFSNPTLRLLNDPLGVPGDGPMDAAGGPADARRALNETRATVANFRGSQNRESCPATVTPTDRFVRAPGGDFEARVTTPDNCEWTATASDDFLSVGDATRLGSGVFEFQVSENTGEARTGSMEVAGQSISVEQAGAVTEGVCHRSPPIRDVLVGATKSADCADVTEEQLARIEYMRLVVSDLGAGDLDGLTGMRELQVTINSGSLPDDLFADLSSIENLRVIGFFGKLPDDVFVGLPRLRILLVDAPLTELSFDTFQGLTALRLLWLSRTRLSGLPAGIFDGLSGLTSLTLWRNQLIELPADLFTGLSSLEDVTLADNSLSEIKPDLFGDQSSLERLDLSHNALQGLPTGFFADMSSLDSLDLSHNAIRELPVGFFAGLSALDSLTLSHNVLTQLPDGVFADLPGLTSLDLSFNGLANLQPNVFNGLSSLELLNLGYNRFRSAPSHFWKSTPGLKSIGLGGNSIAHVSEDAFLRAPETLRHVNLAGNLLDDLPAGVFTPLRNIHVLDLEMNGLKQLPDTLFPKEPRRWRLYLGFNNLTRLPRQLFAGIRLQHLFLDRNPGSPFAFPVNLHLDRSEPFPSNARTFVAALDRPTPFSVNVLMEASNATLSSDRTYVSGTDVSDPIRVQPGLGSLVSVSARAGVYSPCFFQHEPCYRGVATPTGPPLTWFNTQQYTVAGGERAIFDLADVFGVTQGSAFTYSAKVDDPALIEVTVDDGILTVESNEDDLGGTATLTLTATGADGVERTQQFLFIVEELGRSFMRGWRKGLFAKPPAESGDGS